MSVVEKGLVLRLEVYVLDSPPNVCITSLAVSLGYPFLILETSAVKTGTKMSI